MNSERERGGGAVEKKKEEDFSGGNRTRRTGFPAALTTERRSILDVYPDAAHALPRESSS